MRRIKPPGERLERGLQTKKRLGERRGLKLRPDRVKRKPWGAISSRHYAFYRDATGIDFEKRFKGKRVLDVACGNAYFVREARKKGILAEGLDPAAPLRARHVHRGHVDKFEPRHKYECVISLLGLPGYSSNAFNVRHSLYHMLRLVEPGGVLVIHPYHPIKISDKVTGSLVKKLEFFGFEPEFLPPALEEPYGTLVMKKKSEKQLEQLGKKLGVI